MKQATPLTMLQKTNRRENSANDSLNSDVTERTFQSLDFLMHMETGAKWG
jgi:hypothetical protein